MNGFETTRQRVRDYEETWEDRGYPEGIPDEVPAALMAERLAPSYKAICLALLRNDMHLTQLGYSAPWSEWYSAFKKIEITGRVPLPDKSGQMWLF